MSEKEKHDPPTWVCHVPGYAEIAEAFRVTAWTKGEARSVLKRKLHFKGRLPVGTKLEKA